MSHGDTAVTPQKREDELSGGYGMERREDELSGRYGTDKN